MPIIVNNYWWLRMNLLGRLFLVQLMKHYTFPNLSEGAQAFTSGFFQLISSLAETFVYGFSSLGFNRVIVELISYTLRRWSFSHSFTWMVLSAETACSSAYGFIDRFSWLACALFFLYAAGSYIWVWTLPSNLTAGLMLVSFSSQSCSL